MNTFLSKWRVFWATTGILFCLLLTAGGLLTADVATRTRTFEEPAAEYMVTGGVGLCEGVRQCGDSAAPIPWGVRVVGWLVNGERALWRWMVL